MALCYSTPHHLLNELWTSTDPIKNLFFNHVSYKYYLQSPLYIIIMNRFQLKERIALISKQKRNCDENFSDLQRLVSGEKSKRINVGQLRRQFASAVQHLIGMIQNNSELVNSLIYKSSHIAADGQQMGTLTLSLSSLQEYFEDLRRKVKKEQERGEQVLSERERWELIGQEKGQGEEETSLLTSIRTMRETNEMARGMLGSVSESGGKLQQARERMSSFLKNISLTGSILHMLKNRSQEDNRLIAGLSLGLVLWIILCIFVLKPYFRGT